MHSNTEIGYIIDDENEPVQDYDPHYRKRYYSTSAGPRLNIKTVFPRYGDSHVKDKTVGETVLYLTWELPYLVRPSFLLRRPPVHIYYDWFGVCIRL